jgi:hypothetical protein
MLFAGTTAILSGCRAGLPAVPGAVGGIVVVAALHGVAGVGVGELLRNPALAVGAVLGWDP